MSPVGETRRLLMRNLTGFVRIRLSVFECKHGRVDSVHSLRSQASAGLADGLRMQLERYAAAVAERRTNGRRTIVGDEKRVFQQERSDACSWGSALSEQRIA